MLTQCWKTRTRTSPPAGSRERIRQVAVAHGLRTDSPGVRSQPPLGHPIRPRRGHPLEGIIRVHGQSLSAPPRCRGRMRRAAQWPRWRWCRRSRNRRSRHGSPPPCSRFFVPSLDPDASLPSRGGRQQDGELRGTTPASVNSFSGPNATGHPGRTRTLVVRLQRTGRVAWRNHDSEGSMGLRDRARITPSACSGPNSMSGSLS